MGGAISFIVWTVSWLLFNWFVPAANTQDGNFLFITSWCALPMVATLCGLIIALALKQIKLVVPQERMSMVAAGWACGFFLSEIIGGVTALKGDQAAHC